MDHGRITPLIVKAVRDIANITSTFQQNLITWLSSASKGITDLFAQRIHTEEICVGDSQADPTPLCVTKPQLAALLSAANASPTSGIRDLTRIQYQCVIPPKSLPSAAHGMMFATLTYGERLRPLERDQETAGA